MQKITKTTFLLFTNSHTDDKQGRPQQERSYALKKYSFANFIIKSGFASENSLFVVSLGLLKTLEFRYPKTLIRQVRAWPDSPVTNPWSPLEAGYPSPTLNQKYSVQPLKQKSRPVLPYLNPGEQTSSKSQPSDLLLCNSEYWCRSPLLQCPASPVQLSRAPGFHNSLMSAVAALKNYYKKSTYTPATQHTKGK